MLDNDIKISMIGQKGIAAKDGGVERHVEELAQRLAGDSFHVTVYARSTYMQSSDDYNGIKIKIIKTFESKSLDAIVYSFKAAVAALFAKTDIFHFHALGPSSMCFLPRLFGKKVVCTVHGLDWQREKWGKLGKLYLKFGEHILGKCSKKIITVSEPLRRYFIEKYKRSPDDVIFIPNGVNAAVFKEPELIKSFGLSKNSYILFLARLTPEKGVHYLIEAYKKMQTDIKLVIAGDGSFTDTYVSEIKASAKDIPSIIFTGNVSGDLLYELFSNCRLFVLPSTIEGMPIALLEAMSYGNHCIVSDIDANLAVIENGVYGDSFENKNPDDLRQKIEAALSDENRSERIGWLSMQNSIKKYNWNSAYDAYIDVLSSL